MSTSTTRTKSAATGTEPPLRCRLCGEKVPAGPVHVCEYCFGPLEAAVPASQDGARITRERIQSRPPDLWRYIELLPLRKEPRLGHGVGFTPLLPAPQLGARLGIDDLWIKNDAANHPTLSFKDRVVAVALNKAIDFGLTTVGCASTGNLANSVAAQAAGAGLEAWIFIPEDLEPEKIVGSAVYGPRLVRIGGVYDDVNRLCAEVADRYGWGIVNVNLRPYYAEGSKTMAFEIAEQLGWRAPANVVAPMAGGSLITKLDKGFREFEEVGLIPGGGSVRLFGAQAGGCAPIVEAFHREDKRVVPVRPNTIARSLAIGNPADGPFAVETMSGSGGWAESVTDEEIAEAMVLLAESEGIFAETAGGVTVGAAKKLAAAGRLPEDGPTVLCITGHGLKTPGAVGGRLHLGPVIEPTLGALAEVVDES